MRSERRSLANTVQRTESSRHEWAWVYSFPSSLRKCWFSWHLEGSLVSDQSQKTQLSSDLDSWPTETEIINIAVRHTHTHTHTHKGIPQHLSLKWPSGSPDPGVPSKPILRWGCRREFQVNASRVGTCCDYCHTISIYTRCFHKQDFIWQRLPKLKRVENHSVTWGLYFINRKTRHREACWSRIPKQKDQQETENSQTSEKIEHYIQLMEEAHLAKS